MLPMILTRLCLGIGWWLTTRAIRPVEEISAAANRISAGNLSERVAVADKVIDPSNLAGPKQISEEDAGAREL